MKFYFCETCGKRVTDEEARDKKLKGVFCKECAQGVNTIQFDAITEPVPVTPEPTITPPAPVHKKAAPADAGSAHVARNPSKMRIERVVRPRMNALPYAAAAVIALLVIGWLVVGGTQNSQPVTPAVHETTAPATAAPAAATAPAPAISTPPAPRVDAATVSGDERNTVRKDPEKEAEDAFQRLIKFEGIAPDDKPGHIAACEKFLKEHGDSIVSARARIIIEQWKAPVTASPSTNTSVNTNSSASTSARPSVNSTPAAPLEPAGTAGEHLEPGQRLALDFEGTLDSRWNLTRGAAVTDEQAHGGKKSLKLSEGQTAALKFAGKELPVKITLWIYDKGRKFGTATVDGPAWGITDAAGHHFCMQMVWRAYLAGDSEYSWINTGENQWFSHWHSRVSRTTGWNEWIFDFSNPAAPKFTGGGAAVGSLKPEFTPKGALGLLFAGGSKDTGPLYVDDIVIEYPKK